MAQLKILQFPDPRLRQVAKPVGRFDRSYFKTFDDMFDTMYAAPGVGLAATQVGIDERFTVIDVSDGREDPLVLINPEIITGTNACDLEEGCLSVPGHQEKVRRFTEVRVRALDRDGKPIEFEADGLLAHCIQHEIDHLDGKLFVDYLSQLKRNRIRKQIEREQRR
nr:peptide deformylase [Oceanococcus sp. HetDA_MAG_MS8]